MKKMDNCGFTIGTMLAFICFFLVILAAIAIIAYNNGVNKKNPIKNDNTENKFVLP